MQILSDDAVNIEKGIYTKSIIEIFYYLYEKNSRVFCDLLAYLIYRIPFQTWKVIDSFIYLLICILLTYNFTHRTIKDYIFACFIVLLFPFDILSSAGYIATTTNYIYTIFGILVIIFSLKSSNNCNNMNISNVIAIFLIPYVTNHDQTAFALILILLYLLIINRKNNNKTYIFTLIVYLAIALICYYTFYNMPGHKIRSIDYLSKFSAPNYLNWTIFDKLYYGFTSTIAYIFFYSPIAIVLLSICLILIIFEKNKRFFLVSLFPLVYELLVRIIGKSFFIVKYDYTFGLPEIGQINIKNLLIMFSAILLIIVFVIIMFNIEDNIKYNVIFSCVVGFLSHMAMGFSRTIYGSSFRTFTLFYFCILYCAISIFNISNDNHKNILLLLATVLVILT